METIQRANSQLTCTNRHQHRNVPLKPWLSTQDIPLSHWRDLPGHSFHPKNAPSKWDSGPVTPPSSSDPLLLPPVWHHKLTHHKYTSWTLCSCCIITFPVSCNTKLQRKLAHLSLQRLFSLPLKISASLNSIK